MPAIRNRIVEHVRVRAGELLPHPLNFRRHSAAQKKALAASYQEVGFTRSLLGYRRSDGRIQLIDGHLRRDLEPEMEVTVEIVDVSEEEARKLLLSIDPIAALAETDAEALTQIRAMTSADSEVLRDFWKSLLAKDNTPPPALPDRPPEQFLILVHCHDEAQQVELLERLQSEGIACKPLIS